MRHLPLQDNDEATPPSRPVLTGPSNTKWQRALNLTLQLITSGRQPTGDNRWIPNHEPSVE